MVVFLNNYHLFQYFRIVEERARTMSETGTRREESSLWSSLFSAVFPAAKSPLRTRSSSSDRP